VSQQRLRRLAKLESRRPAERPWRPCPPEGIALLQHFIAAAEAVRLGRASTIPFHGPRLEPSDAKRRALAELDRIAARFAAERAG
jgi:hypothetical protein